MAAYRHSIVNAGVAFSMSSKNTTAKDLTSSDSIIEHIRNKAKDRATIISPNHCVNSIFPGLQGI
jgi:hypothetical protein